MMKKNPVLIGILFIGLLCTLSGLVNNVQQSNREQATYVSTYGVTQTQQMIEINLFGLGSTATATVTPTATVTSTPTVTMTATATLTPINTPVSQGLIPWKQMWGDYNYIFCDTTSCIPGMITDREDHIIWYTGWGKGRENTYYSFATLMGGYQMIPIKELTVGKKYWMCQDGASWPFVFDNGKDATEFVFANNDCLIGEYQGQFIGVQKYGGDGVLTKWSIDNYRYTVHYLDGAYAIAK